MTTYLKNTHAIRRLLVKDYGNKAKDLRLVRNPYNKSLLSVTLPLGTELEFYVHVPKLGWMKH